MLNSLTNGYAQIAIIFPIVVAAPRYFSGGMQLGGLMQTVGAFGSVQSSMSWFVRTVTDIARWRAIVERLSTFHRAIIKARAEANGGFVNIEGKTGVVQLRDVTMNLPDGTKLLEHADYADRWPFRRNYRADRVRKVDIVPGLAGIWPFGRGEVELPPNSFFLPQRPYIPLGTLRHVVTYPEREPRLLR